MANGTMVDAAAYYNDNITYTGDSGSETNPFCIEDCYDFMVANVEDIYYMMVKNVDFNDHPVYKYGFDKYGYTNDAVGGYLLGNNKELRNIIIKYEGTTSSKLFNFQHIKDLKIINVINLGSLTKLIKGSMENCSLSIYVVNPKDMYWLGSSPSCWTNCSINIKGVLTKKMSTPILKNCHLNLDLNTSESTVFGDSFGFDNSYITGKVTMNMSATNPYFMSSLQFNKILNVLIAVELYSNNDSNTVSISSSVSFSPQGTCAIDAGICNCWRLDNKPAKNIYFLTTEQMKDINYLTSIGFLVIPFD